MSIANQGKMQALDYFNLDRLLSPQGKHSWRLNSSTISHHYLDNTIPVAEKVFLEHGSGSKEELDRFLAVFSRLKNR